MSKRKVYGIMFTLLLIGMLTLAFNIQPVNSVKMKSGSTIGFYGISYEIYYDSLVSYLKTVGYTVFAVDELNFTCADVVYVDYRVSYPLTEEELLDYVEDGGSLWVYGEAVGGTFLGVTISTDSIWFDGSLSDSSVWVREHPLLKDVKSIVYPDGAWIENAGNFEEIVSINEKVILAVDYSECGKILWLPDSDIFGDYFLDDGDNSILARNIAAWLTTRTWIVDDDGPADFSSIQETINNANEGDTIYVRNGTYYENVVVNKTVLLIGENKATTIIDGENQGIVIYVRLAERVNISGFTVKRSGVGWIENMWDGRWPLSGIVLWCSDKCIVAANIITDNFAGVTILSGFASPSECNTIKGNLITNTTNVAIYLSRGPEANWVHSNNTIIENNVLNNWFGLLCSWYDGNHIYHNNFINNTYQVFEEDSFNNTWDSGCEGNYWSDYNGTDSDEDGIGDTSYVIDENNTDNFPLMNLYWNKGDVDHDLDVDLYDAVRLLVAYGSKIGDEHYNCHCDITEPYGKIDLFDAVLLLVNYGKKYS